MYMYLIIVTIYVYENISVLEIRDTFRLFDKDGDGKITTYELGMVVRACGKNPTEKELEEMMSTIDKNGKFNT